MTGSRQPEDRLRLWAGRPLEELRNYGGLETCEAKRRKLLQRKDAAEGFRRKLLPLRRAFLNPFSVVLLVLAVISCLVDVVLRPAAERNYTTVLIISLMLLVSGCVRLVQELRAARIAHGLTGFMDGEVQVRREGQWRRQKASELAPGDVIRVTAGERIQADIRITEARSCFVSESAITGESDLREKTAETLQEEPKEIREFRNMGFCGTTVVSGSMEGIAVAVGKQTLYGAIAPAQKENRQGYDRGANSIARVLVRFMVLLVPLVFAASGLTKGNWLSSLLFALSVAVGLTPELLPMVITACLARGSAVMGRKQTIVKNINAMQAFGSMDVLCVDKTGTLTEDRILLEYYMDILGNEDRSVLDCAYLSSFYLSGVGNHLDAAIRKTEEMPGGVSRCEALARRFEKLDELPFDYSRKLTAVLLREGERSFLLAKGGVDQILSRCSCAIYRSRKLPMDAEGSRSAHAIVDEMLEDGMKVLAVAGKEMEGDTLKPGDEEGLTLLGYLAFFDPPRQTAASAVRKLALLHTGTKVLTGDSLDVAVSICRRLNMDVSGTMTGRELDRLSENDAQVRVEETGIFAELTPGQKARIVEILQSNGHTVGYLADGMNDLPAVLQSDVGISVDTAVPSVRESADVILLKKDLNVLENGITEGRRAFANMSKYVKITASSNLGNIFSIVFAGIFLPFFPMTSVQLLLLNLLYDILCLVLPWDHVDREMVEKPLEWSGRNLRRFMLAFGPISSVFDLITFAFLYGCLCPALCGGAYSTLMGEARNQFVSLFQTGWFLESMWTQVLILHLLRTDRVPFLGSRPSGPVLGVTLLGIGAFTLLAQTPLGGFLGMTQMPAGYFVFLILIVLCYLLAVTLAKRLYVKHFHCLI